MSNLDSEEFDLKYPNKAIETVSTGNVNSISGINTQEETDRFTRELKGIQATAELERLKINYLDLIEDQNIALHLLKESDRHIDHLVNIIEKSNRWFEISKEWYEKNTSSIKEFLKQND